MKHYIPKRGDSTHALCGHRASTFNMESTPVKKDVTCRKCRVKLGLTVPRTPLQEMKMELAKYKAAVAKKDAEIKANPDIQDDTEWVNDYHNLTGWVEALGYAIGLLDKK